MSHSSGTPQYGKTSLSPTGGYHSVCRLAGLSEDSAERLFSSPPYYGTLSCTVRGLEVPSERPCRGLGSVKLRSPNLDSPHDQSQTQ